jgi:uncharacterized protein (DUF952 family)
MLTYHLALQAELEAQTPTYAPSTFQQEGFIHTTRRREHLHEVANRYYQNDPRLYVVIAIELAALTVMWRYDLPNDEYPHLYGTIPRYAIVHTEPISRASDGAFLPLPSDKKKTEKLDC